jgi:diguanylate cyclase (GGDEF)-like protein
LADTSEIAMTMQALASAHRPPRWQVFAAPLLLLGAVSWIDYILGASVNLLALYFVPLLVAGWHLGKKGAVLFTALATAAWLAQVVASGAVQWSPLVWAINTLATATGFLVVAILVALLRNAIDRERDHARTDPLTGLANRRQLEEGAGVPLALCRRIGSAATMVSVDLDNFKAVNDTLGHQRGDDVLRAFGDILRRFVRTSDFAARMGGDEFCLFLPDTSALEGSVLMDRIRAAAEASPMFRSCDVSLSIGSYTEDPVHSELEAMLSAADARMYEAKRSRKPVATCVLMPTET